MLDNLRAMPPEPFVDAWRGASQTADHPSGFVLNRPHSEGDHPAAAVQNPAYHKAMETAETWSGVARSCHARPNILRCAAPRSISAARSVELHGP
jgi:hypothetical protein